MGNRTCIEHRRPPARATHGMPHSVTLVLAVLPLLGACTSVQWMDGRGEVQVLGLARATEEPDSRGVTRIVAPGASLRLIPGLEGYAIGWREALIFTAQQPDGTRRTAAFADLVYGLRVDPSVVVIGTDRRFGVFLPPDGDSVVQDIRYHGSGGPLRGRIETKEMQ